MVQKKKPGRKPKKKLYFDMDVQDAIVRYNALDRDKDQAKRNKIYTEEIHTAFDKLCENIINTFKFEYFDDVYVDVKHEVCTFLVMNMHKYDHTKGSKAFSYFSVVAKNYLILHNNANYKKYKMHNGLDSESVTAELSMKSAYNYKDPEYVYDLFGEIIKYFELNIPKFFKKKKDMDVAYAILELMERREEIENFNKKSLYILIREMTNVETSHITKVANVMRTHYNKITEEFLSKGYITHNKKNNLFF